MSVVFRGTFDRVIARWRWEPAAEGEIAPISDRIAARAWLAQRAAEPGVMRGLRRLLGERLVVPAFGIDDGEVLDRVAAWIAAGELRLTTTREAALGSWGDEEEAAPVAAVAPAPEPEPEPTPEEERTFGDDIDAEAIAAAMKEAAELGVPFCEECTKKKLARERAAREQGAAA